MVAMEAPARLDDSSVRGEKAKVLKAVHPITQEEAPLNTVRGQYSAGVVAGSATSLAESASPPARRRAGAARGPGREPRREAAASW